MIKIATSLCVLAALFLRNAIDKGVTDKRFKVSAFINQRIVFGESSPLKACMELHGRDSQEALV